MLETAGLFSHTALFVEMAFWFVRLEKPEK